MYYLQNEKIDSKFKIQIYIQYERINTGLESNLLLRESLIFHDSKRINLMIWET